MLQGDFISHPYWGLRPELTAKMRLSKGSSAQQEKCHGNVNGEKLFCNIRFEGHHRLKVSYLQ